MWSIANPHLWNLYEGGTTNFIEYVQVRLSQIGGGTMPSKKPQIKLFVDEMDKEAYVKLAEQQGVSVSKLVQDIATPIIKHKLDEYEHKQKIADRAVATDKKLMELKDKLIAPRDTKMVRIKKQFAFTNTKLKVFLKKFSDNKHNWFNFNRWYPL